MKVRKTFGRILSLAAAVFILAASVSGMLSASAAQTTKSKSYDIAVVYDNSGSMYELGGKSRDYWCHAKYAMEIFASMLDYDGQNKLTVYPMWAVSTAPGHTDAATDAGVVISSAADVQKIHNMYTPKPSGTPFEPVNKAVADLEKSAADVKWLIILTDGKFDNGATNVGALRSELDKVANKGIKSQFICIGSEDVTPLDDEEDFHTIDSANGIFAANPRSSDDIKDTLIAACNTIFERSKLDDKYLSGGVLTLPTPMTNLIIFVQGGTGEISAALSQGEQPLVPKSTFNTNLISMSSPEESVDVTLKKNTAMPSSKMFGQVFTYENLKKGQYNLKAEGASSVQIFYVPEVDIAAKLVDKDGQVIGGEGATLYAGQEYTLQYFITYRDENGATVEVKSDDDSLKDVLGTDVDYTAFINNEQTQKSLTIDPEGAAVDEGDRKIKIEYDDSNGKYYVVTDSGERLEFSGDEKVFFKVGAKTADFDLSTENSKDRNMFKIRQLVVLSVKIEGEGYLVVSKQKEWKPFKVTVTVNGKKLSDDELSVERLTLTPMDSLHIEPGSVKLVPGESAFTFELGKDAEGNFVDIEKGTYSLEATYKYTDKDGGSHQASDKKVLIVTPLTKLEAALIAIGIIGGLTALILFIGRQKAFPKKVSLKFEDSPKLIPIQLKGSAKSASAVISGRRYGKILSGKATPLTNRFQRGSQKAKFSFVLTSASDPDGLSSFTIGSETFTSNGEGGFTDRNGNEVNLKDKVFTIENPTNISWSNDAGLSHKGQIKINEKR